MLSMLKQKEQKIDELAVEQYTGNFSTFIENIIDINDAALTAKK